MSSAVSRPRRRSNRGTSSRRRNNRPRARNQMTRNSSHPPQFRANTQFAHRIRYTGAASFSSTVSRGQLLSTFLLNLANGTSFGRLVSAIRVKRIEMWGAAVTSASSAASVAVTWLSNYGPNSEVSDSSTSTASPAHLITGPPAQSLASFWSIAGSNESEIVFRVAGPIGTIIDVWYDFTLVDGVGTTVTTTNAGSTNNLYVTDLDGPAGSAQIVPVSVASIN